MNQKNVILFTSLATVFVIAGLLNGSYNANAQIAELVTQNTTVSRPDPLQGHQSHQLVVVAPPQEGSIWTGTASWTASKPVEAVILHPYSNVTNATALEQTQVPLNAQLGNNSYAISLIKPTGENTNAGSIEFTGTAFALHNIQGDPFVVSYTVDAEATDVPVAAGAEADDEDEDDEEDDAG